MFRFESKHVAKALAEKKDKVICRSPKPACEICDKCWYQGKCLLDVLRGYKPLTCCIFQLFSNKSEETVEEIVKYVCENKCVERQTWIGDPVPHTPDYCKRHCPMMKYLLDLNASAYEDVPNNF